MMLNSIQPAFSTRAVRFGQQNAPELKGYTIILKAPENVTSFAKRIEELAKEHQLEAHLASLNVLGSIGLITLQSTPQLTDLIKALPEVQAVEEHRTDFGPAKC